jgi:hypothetical protein
VARTCQSASLTLQGLDFVTSSVDRRKMTPLRSNATGDTRPHYAAYIADRPDAPRPIQGEPGKVIWFGKPLYIGDDTQVSRFFWLLAERPGRWHHIAEVQESVFGIRTDASFGMAPGEIKKADLRLRKVASRLRDAFREHRMSDHAKIIRDLDDHSVPGYELILRQHQGYQCISRLADTDLIGELERRGYRVTS